MVVYVVHTRRERRGGRAGEGSSAMSKNLVRLASRAVKPAIPSGAGGRSLSRAGGGRPLRATSPPPPSSISGCTASWESRSLRRDGEEDWEEVVAAGARPGIAGFRGEATEEQGVVFGAPPTDDEVCAAVASIKQVFEKPSDVDSDAPELTLALPMSGHPSCGLIVNHFALDSGASEVGSDEWTEPAMLVRNSSALLTKEHGSVLDALRLLHEDPSVQKMVMALSKDKAVWHAVMENEVVQEFKRSFQDAKETDLNGRSTAPPGFMMWVLENTQAKIKEFLEKILGLVNMLFQSGDKDYDMSDDIVRMSFMLSVFVFIVVTIARIH
ncbi:hypothetical protein SETIT_7G189400v2 [Setaria italica]|uniref:Uncharacterized protein n=1 Tax=Setaria italica TaxID=4555 RepID=K3Y8Q2_SETIT|nr:uncharacterized protein LOC101764532 [Setaria italica]RCV34834.1 hypothetical protein SETIT_7G189400v2 [Setaria italica]